MKRQKTAAESFHLFKAVVDIKNHGYVIFHLKIQQNNALV